MHREVRLPLAQRSISFRQSRLWALGGALALASFLTACDGGAPSLPPGGGETPPPGGPTTPPLPAVPDVPQPHACNMRISDVSVYQGVRVPLIHEGEPVSTRNVPLIEGRRAYFRAYLAYDGAPAGGQAVARLKIQSAGGMAEYEARGLVSDPSAEAFVNSTLNFDVPGEAIHADSKVTVSLFLGSDCGGARTYPNDGPLALQPIDTGVLKVVLVPIQYDADGSGRLPNLAADQIEKYRQALMAVYPTRQVDITVREPVSSRISLTSDSGWPQTLDGLRDTRSRDAAPRDVYYYGLVEPATSFGTYCKGACVAGLSYLVDGLTGTKAVGMGVGFATGTVAGETLVHELGHEHGRAHSPCGGGAGIDQNFPDKAGGIVEWGLDLRADPPLIQDPAKRKDMMGYCNPTWISDYTYNAIADRRSAVSANALVARELRTPEPLVSRRTLLVDAAGRTTWGHAVVDGERPDGRPQPARVLDASGVVIEEITVYRTDFGHGGGASLDVPVARPGWAALAIDGLAPVEFASQAAPVPSLEPALAR